MVKSKKTYILIGLFIHAIAACTSCAAQVAQKGITLEYNRSERKTTYTKPVYGNPKV